VFLLCSWHNLKDFFFNHDEQEVDTNLIANLLTAKNEEEKIRQLRVNYKKHYIIENLNINSLPNTFVEIQDWLMSNAINILSVQETKIDQSFPNSQFHVDGYNLFRQDRTKGGGGIAVHIQDNIITSHKKQGDKQL